MNFCFVWFGLLVYALADQGGAAGAPAPPTGPNSFIFAFVFTENCPCQRLAPPNVLAPTPHPQQEILDRPLVCEFPKNSNVRFYGVPGSPKALFLSSSLFQLCCF